MKVKFAVPLLVLSVASTSALAAASQSGSTQDASAAYANQQFQSMNNGTGVHAGANWFNKIQVSGLLNVDGYFQTNSAYLGYENGATKVKENSQSAFTVGDAALNLDSQVNSWTNAHVSLFFADSSHQPIGISGKSSANTRYYPSGDTTSGVSVDEAYVDVGNFAQAPFMLRVGRQYLPFGQYDRYAMLPSLTQQLSETRATALELGYVNPMGLHAAVYGFRGVSEASSNGSDHNNNIRNGGVAVGYTNLSHKIGFDVGGGYLYNMRDVGVIANAALNTTYAKHVPAWAAHATLMTGPFSLGVKYVSALGGGFNTADLGTYTDGTSSGKAQPDAGNVFGTYAFKTMGYNSKLTASWQWSDQAFTYNNTSTVLTLPSNRAELEYDVNIMQNTMLGFAGAYDSAYDNDNRATGDHNFTGMARLSVLL